MNKDELMNYPLRDACGAVRHDHFFKTDKDAFNSIIELSDFAKTMGAKAMLRREYPDTGSKNIIVNIIDGKPYVIDGNRHCVSLLIAEPDLTFGDLEALRPGILRVWQAGVEEGKNTPEEPYEVYIPIDVDISGIPGARQGTDYFKDPPAPTNIVPGSFPPNSRLLPERDRGRPLGETVDSLLQALDPGQLSDELPDPEPAPVSTSQEPAYEYFPGSGGYGSGAANLPCKTDGGTVYIDTVRGQLLDSDEDISGTLCLSMLPCNTRICSIGQDAFNRRTKLSGIVFSDTVTFIGNAAFYGCDRLSIVTMPPRLEFLGDDAFGSCGDLLSVIFPGSANAPALNIGGGAFARCEKLTSVTFLGNVNSIGSGAFYDCKKLMSVTFNGAVTSIDSHAFSGCSCLVSITLPPGIRRIGEGAFDRCENLLEVRFMGTREQWQSISIASGNDTLMNAEIRFLQ